MPQSFPQSRLLPNTQASDAGDEAKLEYLDAEQSILVAYVPSMKSLGETETAILQRLKDTRPTAVILDFRGNAGGQNAFADYRDDR